MRTRGPAELAGAPGSRAAAPLGVVKGEATVRYSAGLLALGMMLVVGLCALGTSCARQVSAASTPAGSSGTVPTAGTTAAQAKLPDGLTDDLSKAMHVPPDDVRSDLEARGAVVNVKDGSILVPIPEEAAIFGSPEGVGNDAEHPQFRTTLPAYYIAAHEVTNAQWQRFDEATGYGVPWPNGRIPFGCEEHPVDRLGWHASGAYCEWAELRLPSELEWERAARGTNGLEYPWGDEWDATRCLVVSDEETCRVWEYPQGRCPYGLFHMAGNVGEWCADWYEPGAYAYYASGDLTSPPSGTQRVVRGGDSSMNEHFARCTTRWYSPPVSSAPGDRHGFRCARDLPAD